MINARQMLATRYIPDALRARDDQHMIVISIANMRRSGDITPDLAIMYLT
jgi:hypothetical protein